MENKKNSAYIEALKMLFNNETDSRTPMEYLVDNGESVSNAYDFVEMFYIGLEKWTEKFSNKVGIFPSNKRT